MNRIKNFDDFLFEAEAKANSLTVPVGGTGGAEAVQGTGGPAPAAVEEADAGG